MGAMYMVAGVHHRFIFCLRFMPERWPGTNTTDCRCPLLRLSDCWMSVVPDVQRRGAGAIAGLGRGRLAGYLAISFDRNFSQRFKASVSNGVGRKWSLIAGLGEFAVRRRFGRPSVRTH